MTETAFVYDLVVNGGPPSIVLAVLYVRQTRMIRVLASLAARIEGVDEEDVRERIRIV